MPSPTRADLEGRLALVPGMGRLLPALEGLTPSYLVGGAVRDLIRGAASIDLDVAVEGDIAEVAEELARRLGGDAVVHDRFGTATVRAGDLVVDLARTRRESYQKPGALPDVEPAGLEEDLRRRDFTINAMALGLSEAGRGELVDPAGGAEDLGALLVRALHPRSFIEDPTRILRAARYAARLDFAIDPDTERQMREAVRDGALDTVSGPRVRDELIDLLAEAEVAAAVERLRDVGATRALSLDADPERVAAAALGSMETGADRALAALAALGCSDPAATTGLVERLGLPAPARDAVLRAARRAPVIADALREPLRPSELHALLAPEPPESLAVALALGAPAEPIQRFVAELRPARLEISGADLVEAGVPESPAIGRALDETLRRKLDGELSGRDEELSAALALARDAP